MIANTVNKTGLHPSGVQPQIEHTDLEEELHEKAHIDYTTVAIIPNPSVAALYEDALVYETNCHHFKWCINGVLGPKNRPVTTRQANCQGRDVRKRHLVGPSQQTYDSRRLENQPRTSS